MSRLLDRKSFNRGTKLVSEEPVVSDRPRTHVDMRRSSQDNQLQSFLHNQHQAISGVNEDGEDEELVMEGANVNGDENDTEDTPVSCGVSTWRPRWLQKCYNNKMMIVLLSWFAVLQGFVVNGLNNVNTTSYERRYQLTSTEVGLVSSAYDFAAGLAVVIPSYFGSKGHKPRWLAGSAFLFALGSFVMTLPKLLAGPYSPPTTSEQTALCRINATVCPLAKSENEPTTLGFFGTTFSFPSSYRYLGLLIMGQGLHGLGGSILYSLGTVFIDDNVPQTSSPFYISIFYSFAAVGPALGYIVGGEFLKYYVDFPTVDARSIADGNGNFTSLTDQDAAWVGAWWLGFAIASVLFITVAVSLLCYDKELPEAAVVRRTRVAEHHFTNSFRHRVSSKYTLWHLPRHAIRLLRNPVFLCASISAAMEGAVLSGFATFLPKFIQSRFSQSAFMSALLTGVVVVPSGALAQFASGVIARKLRLKVRGQIIASIISLLLSIALSVAFLLNCEHAPIIGVDEPYAALDTHHYEALLESSSYSPSENLGLESACNKDCGCSTRAYRPVCSGGRYQFFSPCHAGCTSLNGIYGNCSCLMPGNFSSSFYTSSTMSSVKAHKEYEVTDGLCPGECPALYMFLALFFLVVFFTFYVQVPLNTITLRSTTDSERPFAIGLQWILIRFLGTVPGPIVFGSVIDSSCIVWQESQASEQCGANGASRAGACWLYNTRSTSVYLMAVGMVIHFISLMANVVALGIYRPPPGVDLTDPLTRAVARLCFCRRRNGCLASTGGANGDDDKGDEDIVETTAVHSSNTNANNNNNNNNNNNSGGSGGPGNEGSSGSANQGSSTERSQTLPASSSTPACSSSLTRAFHRNKSSDTIALVHCQEEPVQQAPPTPTPSPSAEKQRRIPSIRHFKPSNA